MNSTPGANSLNATSTLLAKPGINSLKRMYLRTCRLGSGLSGKRPKRADVRSGSPNGHAASALGRGERTWLCCGARAELAKLKAGARVVDVGCGHGASTMVMAQAYPNSEFFGFDYHKPSTPSGPPAPKAVFGAKRTW
jgi:2-polyprenyl-3-methyl-5-hydroxy-6-metoxy-1,4-benzoquinol methylase